MCPFVGPHRTLSWFVAQCPRRLLATKISPLANKGTFTNCVDHFRPFFAFWKNEPSHFSVSELLDLKVFFEKNNNYTQSFLLSFQLCFVKWYFPISIYFLLFLIYFFNWFFATGYLTLNCVLWIGSDRCVSKILFESSFGILR